MVDAAYPVVYAGLFAVAESTFASSVNVSDGYDLSEDPGDLVLIGVPSLSDVSAISAGTFTQEQMGQGASGVVQETGSVNGVAMAWNGDGDANAARVAATGYVAALAAAIRADRSLGLNAEDFNVAVQMGTGDIAEDKVNGATCAVSFTVNYIALF